MQNHRSIRKNTILLRAPIWSAATMFCVVTCFQIIWIIKRKKKDWGIDLVVDWVEAVSWNKHVSPQRSLSFYWKIDIFIKKITRSKYK